MKRKRKNEWQFQYYLTVLESNCIRLNRTFDSRQKNFKYDSSSIIPQSIFFLKNTVEKGCTKYICQ